MTAASTVTITAPCPVCGHEATWTGAVTEPGGATAYSEILCNRCEWSFTGQRRRCLERRPEKGTA